MVDCAVDYGISLLKSRTENSIGFATPHPLTTTTSLKAKQVRSCEPRSTHVVILQDMGKW